MLKMTTMMINKIILNRMEKLMIRNIKMKTMTQMQKINKKMKVILIWIKMMIKKTKNLKSINRMEEHLLRPLQYNHNSRFNMNQLKNQITLNE